MDDLNEKRERLQKIVDSVTSHRSSAELLHAGGRTCALQNVDTSEMLKFLDEAKDSITVIAVSQIPARNFTVIFRI